MNTKARLGMQISEARKRKRFRILDLAQRTGRNPARLSEFENGKSNATIEFLEEVGAALGMTLTFVPNDKLSELNSILTANDRPVATVYTIPTLFDEVFIDDSEDNEDDNRADR